MFFYVVVGCSSLFISIWTAKMKEPACRRCQFPGLAFKKENKGRRLGWFWEGSWSCGWSWGGHNVHIRGKAPMVHPWLPILCSAISREMAGGKLRGRKSQKLKEGKGLSWVPAAGRKQWLLSPELQAFICQLCRNQSPRLYGSNISIQPVWCVNVICVYGLYFY